MIRAAAIAALVHHGVQPARRQRRELLQRLADQRQVGVDPRWPRRARRCRGSPACASTRRTTLWWTCSWRGDGPDRSIFRRGSSAGSAPRCQAASPWCCEPRPVVAECGRDGAGGDAGTPVGASGRQGRPHQWQRGAGGEACPEGEAVVGRRDRRVRRQQIIRRRRGVNPDASLFLPTRPVAAPGGPHRDEQNRSDRRCQPVAPELHWVSP